MHQIRLIFFFFPLSLGTYITCLAQLAPGSIAPRLHITDWIAPAVQPVAFENKFIVIDFWATWCAPCIAAMPHIDSLKKKVSDNKDIIFLTMSDEPPPRIRFTLQKFPTETFMITDTTRRTLDSFRVFSIPATFLIDKNGIIRWQGHPQELTEMVISSFIKGKDIKSNEEGLVKRNSPPIPATYAASEKKQMDFSSIYQKYNQVLKDSVVESYFDVDTTASGNMSASHHTTSDSVLKSYQVGIKVNELFAHLLDCSYLQIILPEQYITKKLSYLTKYPITDSAQGLNQFILDKLLHYLHWNMSMKEEDITYYTMVVQDSAKLQKARSPEKSGSSSISTSDGNKILGFKNCTMKDILSQISRIYSKKVEMVGVNGTERYYFTLENDSPNDLKRSLSEYGIKMDEKRGRFPVYFFDPQLN